MSQEITELKAAVDNGIRMYQAFANAQPLVSALASAENYQAEVQARIDALKKEEADLIMRCSALQNTIVTDAQHADAMRAAATAYAAETREQADDEAAEVRLNAKVAAEQREMEADGYVDAAKKDQAEIAADIAAKKTILDELNAKIAAAQETIHKLLGK